MSEDPATAFADPHDPAGCEIPGCMHGRWAAHAGMLAAIDPVTAAQLTVVRGDVAPAIWGADEEIPFRAIGAVGDLARKIREDRDGAQGTAAGIAAGSAHLLIGTPDGWTDIGWTDGPVRLEHKADAGNVPLASMAGRSITVRVSITDENAETFRRLAHDLDVIIRPRPRWHWRNCRDCNPLHHPPPLPYGARYRRRQMARRRRKRR